MYIILKFPDIGLYIVELEMVELVHEVQQACVRQKTPHTKKCSLA